MLPHRVRIDLEAMEIKRYSTFPQNSRTEASASDCFVSYQDIRWEVLTPRQIV